MNSKVTKKMKENLESNVNNYENLDLVDENRRVGLAIISREVKLLNDDEKHKVELKLLKERFKLEKQKTENQLAIDNRRLEIDLEKFNIELRKLEIEETKLVLETERFENEKIKQQEELKRQKVDRWINIGMKTLEIGLPLAINALLVFMNFRLIYVDDGRSPSELKDLMRNVYKK